MREATTLERAFASLAPSSNKTEKRSSLSSFFPSIFGGGTTVSNSVSVHNALTLPALYNAVDQITNDIAKLPKSVYQKIDKGREKQSNHPVTYVINKEPNSLMTASSFWKVMLQSAILRSDGLAKIVRNGNSGRLQSLEFINPNDLHDIKKRDGKLWYYIKGEPVLPQDEVYHIPGFSFNGVCGVSIITYAAQTLNIAMKSQLFSYDSFDNRGIGFGAIESDLEVHPTNKKEIEEKVNSKLSGAGKIKTVVLDEGMKYKNIALTPQDAAVVEQGKLSVLDICRFLNISPHKVKSIDGANYNTLEFLSIEHTSDSIQPWATKCTQEADRKLLTPTEKKNGYFIYFNDNILLRADLKAKAEYYSKLVQIGVFTRNEIRAWEEQNTLEGLDDPLTPVNTQTTEQLLLKIAQLEVELKATKNGE